jgi:hypothetical protein
VPRSEAASVYPALMKDNGDLAQELLAARRRKQPMPFRVAVMASMLEAAHDPRLPPVLLEQLLNRELGTPKQSAEVKLIGSKSSWMRTTPHGCRRALEVSTTSVGRIPVTSIVPIGGLAAHGQPISMAAVALLGVRHRAAHQDAADRWQPPADRPASTADRHGPAGRKPRARVPPV